MRNKLSMGHIITAILATAVTAGQGVAYGALFGVAANSADAGVPVQLAVQGEYLLPAGGSFTKGDPVFWNGSACVRTGVMQIGVASAASSAGSVAVVLASPVQSAGGTYALDKIMMTQIYGNVKPDQAQTATNFCYHMTVVIDTDARSFRIPIDNASITLPFRIQSAAIATADSVGADPTIGATTGQARVTPANGTDWTPITWDGGSASVAIPVAPSLGRTTRKWSDRIVCPTVENVDGSKLRVVMLRFWVLGTTSSPGNGYCVGSYTQAWRALAANTALHKGYLWQCIRSTVDGVAVPANFQPNVELSGSPFLMGLEYEAYTPGLTVSVIGGDSWCAGAVNGFTGNFGNGWVWQYVNLLRSKYPHMPIEMANNGVAAANTALYSQRAIDYIASGSKVGMAIYQSGSLNDGTPDAGVVLSAKTRMAAVMSALSAPRHWVITTWAPNTSAAWAAPADDIRKAFNAEIVAMRAPLLNVVDFGVVGTGATPERIVPAWTTDGAHTNELGALPIARNAYGAVKVPTLT